MPNLTIQGKKVNRVNSARVEIFHPTEAREAVQQPQMQFVIEVPLDEDITVAEWALAPYTGGRWKTVELQTTDRSGKVKHTWTLQKAYVHHLREVEFAEGSGSSTDQGNHYEITVRGVLMHANVAYDGKNVLTVAAGEAEPGAQ